MIIKQLWITSFVLVGLLASVAIPADALSNSAQGGTFPPSEFTKRIREIALASHLFRLKASSQPGQAIREIASSECFADWTNRVVSKFDNPDLKWADFFCYAINLIGRVDEDRAVVAFYNPWLDVMLLSEWNKTQNHFKITQWFLCSGESFRGEAIELDNPTLPKWQRDNESLAQTIGNTFGQTRGIFSSQYPTEAKFVFLVPSLETHADRDNQNKEISLINQRMTFRVQSFKGFFDADPASDIASLGILASKIRQLIESGSRVGLEALARGNLDTKMMDLLFNSDDRYRNRLAYNSVIFRYKQAVVVLANPVFPDSFIVLELGVDGDSGRLDNVEVCKFGTYAANGKLPDSISTPSTPDSTRADRKATVKASDVFTQPDVIQAAEAIQARDNAELQRLLNAGVSINATGERGTTLLIWAIAMDYTEGVETLLSAGVSPEAKDIDGDTPIAIAAANSSPSVLQSLIKAGANPNTPGRNGLTPLMLTAYAGKSANIEVLLKTGAEIDMQDSKGNTALVYGILFRKTETVSLLLESGANPFIENKDKKNAFDLIFQTSPAIAEMLSKRRQNVRIQDVFSEPNAVGLLEALIQGDINQAREYLQKGGNVNSVGMAGATPLIWALTQSNPLLFDALLELGADVNQQGQSGASPMLLSAANKDIRFLRSAIRHNGNIQTKNSDGRTPLVVAAMKGYSDHVKLLLAEGVNVNAQDQIGFTALHYAATTGNADIVRSLLSKGARLDLTNNEGLTPKDMAEGLRSQEIIEILTRE